jgi:hypothetical protein
LAKAVADATTDLKQKGRAWEDAQEVVSERLAARDAADDDLDLEARTLRQRLASRSLNAVNEAPYNSVFPQGIEYYTAAPHGENEKRYKELLERLQQALSASDEVRVEAERNLPGQVESWVKAVRELDLAQTQAGIARTALEVASEQWSLLLEKTYGALVQEHKRSTAERFFPRAGGRASKQAADSDTGSAEE